MSVRVEWYGLPESYPPPGPVLRTKGQHWDPDADEEQFVEAEPGVFLPADSDDEVPTEVALVFSGDEVGVICGTAERLRTWINEAHQALAEYENAQERAVADRPCVRTGQVHDWSLAEDGYLRTWTTTLTRDKTGNITGVTATFTGTEDWSESGDEELHLQCTWCKVRREIPDDVEVDYR